MTSPKMYVIDSSVAVKWINTQDETCTLQAEKILSSVEKGKIELILPELAKYEIGNAIWKKGLDLPAAKLSLATLYRIPLQFITQNEEQALETLRIASESNMTYYDASFVSLATSLDIPLITDNPKHQGKSLKAKIIPIQTY